MVRSLLLLLAIALVLIGVVTLVIGIISNTLAWVFISIGATVAAGIVLYVLYRLGRKQAAAATGAAATAEPTPAPPAPSVVPAPTSVPPAPLPAPDAEIYAPAATVKDPAATVKDTGDATTEELRSPVSTAAVDTSEDDFADEDDFFPIAEYEDLRVAEILPLLPELDADELDVVREREASTKARATILNRIDELAPNALGAWSDGAREDVGGEPAQTPQPVAAAPAGRRSPSPSPIPGYDDLKVAEILPILTRLGVADLEAVAAQERRGPNRQTILNRIDGRVRYLEGSGDEAAAPRRGRGPATPTPTAMPKAASSSRAGQQGAASESTPARRGRPRKDASQAESAPARRGRPRKDAAQAAAPATRGHRAATAPSARAAASATAARAATASKAATVSKAPASKATVSKAAVSRAAKVSKATKVAKAAGAGSAAKATKANKTAKVAKASPAGGSRSRRS